MAGFPDSQVLEYACQENRVLLTRNCDDFQALHSLSPSHPGILAVYQNCDVTKNMSYGMIVRSIDNIISAQFPLPGQFVILNQWNY